MPTGITRLDGALASLRQINIKSVEFNLENPVAYLVGSLAEADPELSILICKALQSMEHFNAVVRDNIADQGELFSQRFLLIAESFDSIRDDLKGLMAKWSDGKLDTGEKLSNAWMRLSRGTIDSRFERVKKLYLQVAADTKDQLDREAIILTAYSDFRLVLKEAEAAARKIVADFSGRERELVASLTDLAHQITLYPEGSEARSAAELRRDECAAKHRKANSLLKGAEKISNNLTVGYATTEVVMMRVAQTTGVKEGLLQQMIAFFVTNETAFTGISVAIADLQGVHEATQSLNAMAGGVEMALEALAETGDHVLKEGLRASEGPAIKAEPIKKLADAVIEFQVYQQQMTSQLRAESRENARIVSEAVENVAKRYVELVEAAE